MDYLDVGVINQLLCVMVSSRAELLAQSIGRRCDDVGHRGYADLFH